MEYSDRRIYACEICDLRFTKKDLLQRHVIVHTTERKYRCEICTRTYKYKKGLNRHCTKIHGQNYKAKIAKNRESELNQTTEKKNKSTSKGVRNSQGNISFEDHKEMPKDFLNVNSGEKKDEVLNKCKSKIFTTSAYPLG